MCTTIINDCLFPPVLFCIYLAIALFFCYPKSKPKVKHTDEINLNLLANRERKKCSCQKDKKILKRPNKMIIYSRIFDYIEKFDRYIIYRICRLLKLDYKSFNRYKPLEFVKAEIKQVFLKNPKSVIEAISLVMKENH